MREATFEGEGEWQAAHAALVELARSRASLDFEEGRWLVAARRAEAHRRLGYASFGEYIERLFGYAPRLTHDKLRVAVALEGLPDLALALREARLSFCQVRELTRVATPETEMIWLKSAQGRTAREVEKLVSGRRPGSLPSDAAEPHLERHVLRFEVAGETLASFREAVAKLRQDAGGHLDDDAVLLLMARHVLASCTDTGRASYQVALNVCEACQRATQLADGELVDVAATTVAMARCDAQELPSAHVGQNEGNGSGGNAPPRRATQTVPPAVRRSVLRRDQHRCQVPGCRHGSFLDVHHIETRADGGDHDPDNLVTLCGAHHRAIHEGVLVLAGSISAGLKVCHADGTEYGGTVSAPQALVQARVFRALRGLGFGERDVRQALAQVSAKLGHGAELEVVLRQGLELLTQRAWTRAS